MVLYDVHDPNPIVDPDESTNYTVTTPPETVMSDLLDDDPLSNLRINSSSVPWPGSSFIIRNTSSGHVITLRDGQVMLAPPGGRGSIHWACVDNKGWLGFQSPVSGRFLGHNFHGNLLCSAAQQQGWENFCVRLRPEGGFLLLMTHWDRLWYVGSYVENGMEKLRKVADKESDGIIWEFVKV